MIDPSPGTVAYGELNQMIADSTRHVCYGYAMVGRASCATSKGKYPFRASKRVLQLRRKVVRLVNTTLEAELHASLEDSGLITVEAGRALVSGLRDLAKG